MSVEFKLPSLGENIESGDVVAVLVEAGQTIKVDQPVLELETDKATVEVPSDVDGTIEKVLVSAGDTVAVGQAVLAVAEGVGGTKDKIEEQLEEDTESQDTATEPVQTEEVPPAAAAPEPYEPSQPEISKATSALAASPSVRRFAREIGVDLSEVS